MPVRRSFFDYFEETVPANRKITISCEGRFLTIKESTDQLYCRLDNGKEFPVEVGLDFALEQNFDAQGVEVDKDEFSKLTLINKTSADVDVSFYVGRGKISDYRLNALVTRNITVNVGEAPTFTVGGGGALASGSTETFDGTAGAGKRRKHIILDNPDTEFDLTLLDENGVQCGVLKSRETRPVATDGVLKVKNDNAGSVTFYVLELYYVDIDL